MTVHLARAACWMAVVAAVGVGNGLPAAEAIRPVLGRQIEDFTLHDSHGAKRSLAEWSKSPVIVVAFLGTECPLAKLYGKRLADIGKKYAAQGVQVVGIDANQQDTLEEIAVWAHKEGIEFPVLKDLGAKVADQFGATRTPETFVLDRERTVRYHGRIDNQYTVGAVRDKATSFEVVDAVEALLAGKVVSVANTDVVGCLIGRREPSHATGDVTYAKQISRILDQRCIACHRAGQVAPFTLTDYDDVAAWSDTIIEVVDAGRMPPWHANPKYGDFANDARMPDEEKALLHAWVAGGVPEGEAADLPPKREFKDDWQVPEPRTVYRMAEPYPVPASGTVPYQYFYLDPGFKEDKWVRGAEARPGAREVVHHILLFYLPPGQDKPRPVDPLSNAIAGFAPGLPAICGPEEYAVRIPAGSKLVFQVHYTPNGTPQSDQSEAALVFSDPAKVAHEVRVEAAFNYKFIIPAGDPDYVVTTEKKVDRDSLLYTLNPHMHYRGKSFRFTAHYPDGGEEILLDVPQYDFNWQNVYILKKPKRLPAGTTIELVAHFDNSSDNPLNPDPTKSVHWGDQTWDEMMLGSATVSDADQDLRLGPPHAQLAPPSTIRGGARLQPDGKSANAF